MLYVQDESLHEYVSIGAINSNVCELLRLILTVNLVLFMIFSKGAHRDRALETGVFPEHGVFHALKLVIHSISAFASGRARCAIRPASAIVLCVAL